ncbi:MAG: HAD family phosphatase, partial [Clostridia bacterium]|nr:HAD family phosphatase [Clostridia bacterium]
MNFTVIFDMDGVIFDTERLYMDAWKIVAKQYKLERIEEVVLACTGVNSETTVKIVKSYLGEDFPYEYYRDKVRVHLNAAIEKDGIPQKPGVVPLLSFLKNAGCRIGLASSTRYDIVMSELKDAKLDLYFDQIIGGDKVSKSKPDPEIFLTCAKLLDAVPEQTYVIEDSFNGIKAAYAASMKPIMIPD